jgi:hypothetical protein
MSREKRVDDHCLRRALAQLPSASSEARRRLRLRTMPLGFALFEEKEGRLEIAKDLRAKGLVES